MESGCVLRKKENEELDKKVTKGLRLRKKQLGTTRNGRARGLRKRVGKPRDTELKLGVCGSEHCPGNWAKALDLTGQGRGLGGTDGGASGKRKLSWRNADY